MRLISVKDLTLTEFIGRNAPPYAILSHTWGDDEVSFKDIQHRRSARQQAGFKKIEFCRHQAKADGLDWFWVDTCCIDKTSSAELSESINSMYQWYSQAMVCYAYLSDVYMSPGDPSSLTSLRDSRWFTRGWTLQELLAPLTVKFFTRSWLYIGSKNELASLLNQITRIPKNVLDHTDELLKQTVYERMHWASRRETTRDEDMAYCLLGLFDISLPLLYGEGKKSFLRLQEEIVKQHGCHTIFLWDLHPRKGIPDNGQMLVKTTRIYAGLLAESPRQFIHKCTVAQVNPLHAKYPVQITRMGSQLKLYLKQTVPENIPSWPSYSTDRHSARYVFYLAAIECHVKNTEYVISPASKPAVGDGKPKCSAILLLRHHAGVYERVLSYYETVDWFEVMSTWEYSSCFIQGPFKQCMTIPPEVAVQTLKLRWYGPNLGHNLLDKLDEEGIAVFLFAQGHRHPYESFLVITCSVRYDDAMLDVKFHARRPDNSKPSLKAAAAENCARKGEAFKVRIGPLLEKSFAVDGKDLVLTLTQDEALSGPFASSSGRQLTIWLSFREKMDDSLSEALQKGALN